MFAKNRTQITSEQVVQELVADPDSQWHEYRGRGPITKNQVAALLKDFEIRPVVVHPTKRADVSRHGYRAAQFEDAFARFLPPEPNIRASGVASEGANSNSGASGKAARSMRRSVIFSAAGRAA
jgi:hypothetical protein